MGLENPIHILIILGIVLIVFGPKRLPELGRSLGRGIREFRGSVTGLVDGDERDAAQPAPPAVEARSTPAPAPATTAEPAPAPEHRPAS